MRLLLLLLAIFPQAIQVSWDSSAYDFGAVPRETYELKHDFVFINEGSSPITVSYAVASCSCVSLDWTREAVAPGASGKVSVTYFRERSATSFEKGLSVFFSESSKPVLLSISGYFVETDSSLKEDFPFSRAQLGIQEDPGDFATVHPGETAYKNLWVANLSGKPIKVKLGDLSPGFEVQPSEFSMAPNSRKELMATLSVDSLCLGRMLYSYSPVVDGESQDPVLFKATVLPDWSGLSSAEINSSAYYKVLGDVHHFGVLSPGTPGRLAIAIMNVSDKPLEILSAGAEHNGVSVSAPSGVPARSRADIQVNIEASALVGGANKFTIWFVTDSPLKPFTEFEVMGYVEQ